MFKRTAIAILSLGWFAAPGSADETPKFKPIDPKTVAAYEKLGAEYGGFEFDNQGFLNFVPGKEAAATRLPGFRFKQLPDGMLPKLPPVSVWFGLDLASPSLTDADLKELELKDLKYLTTLDLTCTDLTDAGLKELKNLKNLGVLDISGTHVTDMGLKELNNLKDLTSLNLNGTKITGAKLKELQGLKKLTTLMLSNTKLTDASLKNLWEFKNLTQLDLIGTDDVTDSGVMAIREALPKCRILRKVEQLSPPSPPR